MFEILGVAGIAISVAAYVPQVVHLWREHCSVGVSTRAWAMWVASGLLIGLVAFQRRDPVFILLQVSSLTSAAVILLLAHRYRGLACESHAPPSRDRLRTATDDELVDEASKESFPASDAPSFWTHDVRPQTPAEEPVKRRHRVRALPRRVVTRWSLARSR